MFEMNFIMLLIGLSLFQGYVTDFEYIEDVYVCPDYSIFNESYFIDCDNECMPFIDEIEGADDYCRLEGCTADGLWCNSSCSDAYYEQNMSWVVEPCTNIKDIEKTDNPQEGL